MDRKDQGISYAREALNRLTSITLPGTGGTASFNYDPFGRRICKSSPAGISMYLYDGNNIIQELGGSSPLVAQYTQGLGTDQPLAMYRGLTTSCLHADGLGSVTSLTGPSGAVAAKYGSRPKIRAFCRP